MSQLSLGETPRPRCITCGNAYPCSCITCPICPGGIAPRVGLAVSETLAHVCPQCDWREDRCDCGALMTFDSISRGTTVGGLAIVGARVCVPCGVVEVCKRSKPADAVDWTLAKGGRSLTAGGIKLRAEAGDAADIAALMERLVKLPLLELEVERLEALVAKRSKAA